MRALRRWAIPLVIVIILPIFGWMLDWPLLSAYNEKKCREQHTFVSANVVCGGPDVIQKTGYLETQSAISDYIAAQKSAGVLLDASVYFRDLEHGPTFGINEFADFAPASLLKLPLAFVIFSADEKQSGVLAHKLLLQGTSTIDQQRVLPKVTAEVGQEYTLEELLRMMIVYSDNTSYDALNSFIMNREDRATFHREVFQEIGLIDPKDRVEETITTRGYASLLRLLYNVSYLEVESSETLLGWLADSDYKEGIPAGLPPGLTVAHKFGERYAEEFVQLHDCGVVYYPENPYLICIMTRGADFEKLEEVIRTISRMVYEEFDSRRI